MLKIKQQQKKKCNPPTSYIVLFDKMFIDESMDIITQAIAFTMIGAGLIGYKNFTGSKVSVSKHKSDAAIATGADTSSEEVK